MLHWPTHSGKLARIVDFPKTKGLGQCYQHRHLHSQLGVLASPSRRAPWTFVVRLWVSLPAASFWGSFSLILADFEEFLSFKLKKSPGNRFQLLLWQEWPLNRSENEVPDVYLTKIVHLQSNFWQHWIRQPAVLALFFCTASFEITHPVSLYIMLTYWILPFSTDIETSIQLTEYNW